MNSKFFFPAIESAHVAELGPDGLILVNLSARGDKSMDTATRYFARDADAAGAEEVSK